MSEFNKYSTDGGATFIDVEDSNAVHWADNTILGAKNISKPVKAGQTVNTNNVDYVCGVDGTVTVTGTASEDTGVYTHAFTTDSTKSYKITGCPSGGSNLTYYMRIGIRANAGDNWGTWFADEKGTGVTIPANTSAPYGFVIICRVMNGTAGGGKVFKPMVRLASDTDNTYAPHAMTNRELTDKVTPIGTFETTYTSIATTTTANAWTHLASFTLPKGKWIISVGGRIKNGTANTIKSLAIGVSNTDSIRAVSSFQADTGIMNLTMPFNNTSEQTVYVNAYTTESLGIDALTIDRIRII